MSASEKYFQFPLCALSLGDDERSRLDVIISFGFVDAGIVLFNKLDPKLRKTKADEFDGYSNTPSDYRKADRQHVAAMIGAREIGVNPNHLESSLNRWKQLSEFRDEFQAKQGRDAEVRIKKDLVFEARDKTGITYREFALLCAIVSCIGAKGYPVRITRQRIQCRMLGYKSPPVMLVELPKRTDHARPLTLRQINITLDALHERQFFARARANARQTFYSIRLTQEQLESALKEGKSYSQGFHERRRTRNANLIAAIKERKAAVKVDAAIKVDAEGNIGSNSVHSAFTGASTGASTTASALTRNPLIETPSIETPSTQTLENTAARALLKKKKPEGKPEGNGEKSAAERIADIRRSIEDSPPA